MRDLILTPLCRFVAALCVLTIAVSFRSLHAQDEQSTEPRAQSNEHPAENQLDGKIVFQAKCVRCHGPQGEGTKENPKPLVGDKSVAQLAEVIAESMPEDDPGTLSADEASAAAAYIHDAFYSPIARERNRPARIEVSRLTVRQYRQSLADLIGSFREPARWGDERGVRGEYYQGRRLGGRRRGGGNQSGQAERIDPQISFDFGTEAPAPGITEPNEFSIRWQGSVLAEETGTYDFVVRTDHAARLWVNDLDTPLIDAWVKSGSDTEYSASMFLIAGRPYSLRLEFTKAKQGVDDSDKQKEKPPSPPAFVALLWKRPHGVLEPIPSRNLSPQTAPEVFACATPFPPDDRSYGWIRGSSVSKAWDEATTAGAIETAGYIADHLNELAGTRDGAGDRIEKLQSFCRNFAERAFRRPLTPEQVELFVTRQFAEEADPELAVKRVVLLVLKSPRFLFHEFDEQPDPYTVAARLALGLWDSIPDRELLRAAAENRLATQVQVAQQADRMLADQRAKTKLREFLLTWLHVDSTKDITKNPDVFAGFDDAVIADLRNSLELYLDDVLWSDGSDYRRLLSGDEVFVSDRLAAFYGVASATEAEPSAVTEPPTDAEPSAEGEAPANAESPAEPESPPRDPLIRTDRFEKVVLDPGRRAGVVTHPYIMATFAGSSETSPIHRGVFLARGVLGQSLRPPPEAVAPLSPQLRPDLSTRERVVLQTQDTNCMACHGIINPLGFTLEHFDAVGRYRDMDRGKPVDDTGSYKVRSGETVTLSGARDLAAFLADSDDAHAAFVEQMFHHLVQQPVRAYGPKAQAGLQESFAAHEYHIRRLAVEVMVVSAFGRRDTGDQSASTQAAAEDEAEPTATPAPPDQNEPAPDATTAGPATSAIRNETQETTARAE